MDNKKRRTLAAVLAAAMVAATASVPAFATEDGNAPQTSVLGGGQVIVPSVKSAEEAPEETTPETTRTILVGTDQAAPGYTTVSEALKSLEGPNQKEATIKLMSAITEDITIPKDYTITLDLNGQTIKNVSNHTITNNGKLEIIGNGTVDNVTNQKAAIFNNGTCTLSGGTYTRSLENGKNASESGGNSYYNIVNHGNMTIKDGVTVQQDGQFSSMIDNGWYDGTENTEGKLSTMTINGGTFIGGLNTIKNDDYGELIINGGTFSNVAQAALLNWNIATINGGTFTATSEKDAVILNGKLSANNYDKGKLTITAGTFGDPEQPNLKPALKVMTGASLGEVVINGGTFNGNIDLTGAQDGDSVTFGKTDSSPNGPTINGGVLCAEGAPANLIQVTEGTGVSVPVANEEALKSALAGASEGTTIKLGANIECTKSISIPNGVILDGNDHTISVADGAKASNFENGALINVASAQDKPIESFTIKDLTIDATKAIDTEVDGNTQPLALKHAINCYQATGGTIEGVTITGGRFTAIKVNSSDVTIKDCTLDSKGYANIEFGIGSELDTLPTVTVSGLKVAEGNTLPFITVQPETLARIKELYSDQFSDKTGSELATAVMQYLLAQKKINGVELKVEDAPTSDTSVTYYIVSGSLLPETPTTPSAPSTGGGSSTTQKPLEGISLSMTSAQVGPGDTLQMNVTYTPSDTTASKRVTWTSSDEDVVTVDRNGKVTATGKSGKATITATVGGKTATCTITINPFKVDVEDLNGAVTSCKADGSTVIKVPQSMSYNFDISSGVTLDSFDYTVGNDKVGGTNTITRWNGTSGKYQIYAAGAVGSQTGVYVNGVKLFTIEVTERPFTSDTTLDMSLKVGTPYMFRITPDDKNASFTFLTADGKALSTSYKAALYPDEKGDYYCTVTPLQANRDIGVYCVIGGNTYKVFTVHTIA